MERLKKVLEASAAAALFQFSLGAGAVPRAQPRTGPGRRTLHILHKPGGRLYPKQGERERARRRRQMRLGQ